MARKPKAAAWSLDPAEVNQSVWSTNFGRRQKASQSRSLDVTETTITLRHEPTEIEVKGSVPLGHYSRVEMRALRARITADLLAELERRVAARLRIPGR